MNNFEMLTDEDLLMVNGGKSNKELGREIGHDIAYVANVIWRNTIGCTPVY